MKSVADFWTNFQMGPGCWVWTGPTCDGYGKFGRLRAHRVAWELAHGAIPSGQQVLHRCDNPPCVRPDHLFLGTHDDNMADMIAKGRCRLLQPRGMSHHKARLSDDDVTSIRLRREEGAARLAEEFGVGKRHIFKILRREIWQHLD